MNVMYICDGKNIHCSKTWCKYNGTGTCKHTMSEFYAKYGAVEQITADRFVICDDMAIEIDREDSQPKIGHWEWVQYDGNPNIGNWNCSECHSIGRSYFDYCPYCGAKMSEIQTGQIVANGELYPGEFDDPLAAEGSDKE